MNSPFMQNLPRRPAKTAADGDRTKPNSRHAVSPDSGARSDGGRDEERAGVSAEGHAGAYAQVLLSTNEEIFRP